MAVNVVSRLRHLWGARGLVWTALLTAAAAVLCFVPLFDLLGYESSFVLGLLAAFAGVDMGHRVGASTVARKDNAVRDPRPPKLRMSVWRVAAQAAAAGLLSLVLPLVFLLGNALRIKNCNLVHGFVFFALLPVASLLYGTSMGALLGRAFGPRARILAWSLPLGSLVWSLIRLYRDPPVSALDPFGGFFPGPIYDEALAPPLTLLTFRAANLVWVLAALAFDHAVFTRNARTCATAGFLLLGALVLFFARGQLGFHRGEADVLRELSRRTETEHFVIHSDPRDGQSAADLDLFARELEFRHTQLQRILGVSPAGPVKVFLFPDPGTKKRLVGAEATLFAKPWRREIYVHLEGFPPPRLRHELAHVFAAEFGDPVFGIALAWRLPWPRLASGLIEGLAEATDYSDPRGRATLHESARAILEDGRAPPLYSVIGPAFTLHAGPRAYTLAASFCHFLLTHYGADRLRALYRSGGDFGAVYAQPFPELERAWHAFLRAQPEDPLQRASAREQFRAPSIFKKVCARDIAMRSQRAQELRARDPRAAAKLLASVCADDPGEPTYQLALAEVLPAAGDTPRAIALAQTLLDDEALTHPLRFRAAQLLARLHFAAGAYAQATEAVKRSVDFATDEAGLRATTAQARALADPQAIATLGRVLLGGPGQTLDSGLLVYLLTEFSRQHPDEALGPYLIGRQLAGRDPALSVAMLALACPPEDGPERPAMNPWRVPLPPLFLRECLRLLGETAFRANDLDTAQAAYLRLSERAGTEAERLRTQDFLDRIAWTRVHRTP